MKINLFMEHKTYWDKRFLDEGKIWGTEHSNSAKYALELFKKYDLHKILVPGAGYGRNTKLFSDTNLDVVGIEISLSAINIARSFDPKTKFIQGSVLEMPLDDDIYDGIYCHNVLHLLLRDDRISFLKKCSKQLRFNGYLFFVVFSNKEGSFGKGKLIEENTFESKPWRPTHYFTKSDLIEQFKDFTVIETGIIEDQENHGKLGPHSHILRYIYAKKEKK